jgi:hypothetical protein
MRIRKTGKQIPWLFCSDTLTPQRADHPHLVSNSNSSSAAAAAAHHILHTATALNNSHLQQQAHSSSK